MEAMRREAERLKEAQEGKVGIDGKGPAGQGAGGQEQQGVQGQEVEGDPAGAKVSRRCKACNRGTTRVLLSSHESCCSEACQWEAWHQAGHGPDAAVLLHSGQE